MSNAGDPPTAQARMPGAAFFALRDGRIVRVSDDDNLQAWFSPVAHA